MAITLNNTPLGIYLSRNQAVFQLNCPDAIATAGVSETRSAIISTAIPEDDTLTIAWTFEEVDYSVVFTFKDTPDAAEYEITSNGTAPDRSYVENTLIPGLLSHPDISEFFDIKVEEDTFFGFRLTSRVAGPITLTITSDDFTISGGHTAGVLEVRQPDYLASAWLYVAPAHDSDLDDFTRIGEFELYPDLDGLTDIDLAQLLDDVFTTPETPTATATDFIVCAQLTRQFFFLFGQKYGDPVTRKKQTRSDILMTLKGGVPHSQFISGAPEFPQNATKWRFLTLRTTREVAEDQDDWLFIHVGTVQITSAKIRWKLFFDDGTSLEGDGINGKTLNANKTYQVAAGYEQIGLNIPAAQQAKTPYKYTLKIQGSTSEAVESELITFYLALPDYLEVICEYENSLGAIESWRFTGSRALTGNITAQQYRRALPATPDATFQQLLSFNEQDNPTVTLNTGALNKTDALAFRDFLRSRHKWIRRGNVRIPFRTAPQQYSVDQENLKADYTRIFSFQAILAPERSVSIDDPVWPD